MLALRRWTVAVVLVLVIALAAVPVSAAPVAPQMVQSAQDGQTPDELCAAATADLAEPETREYEAAEDVLQDGVDYWAVMCTEMGAITLDLYEAEAPITVNNFVFLAENGYYNNTTFHRVLPGFMAQGGDPTGTGSGGPGYEFEDETSNGLIFDQIGLLAMANAGENTNGSQFFITYIETSWLDGAHTIFGKVYAGMDVAEKLTLRDPSSSPAYEGSTLDTVLILEGADSLVVEPDGVPSIEHFQYLLQANIADQLTLFGPSVELDFPRDAAAEAAAVTAIAGEELGASVLAYLSDSGFLGSAGVANEIGECSTTAEDSPVWLIGVSVQDYGTAEAAEAAVFDTARADELVAGGLYDAWQDATSGSGRVFSRQNDDSRICGDTGVFYRLELPYGRYVMVTDLVLDSTVIAPDAETTPDMFLAYVAEEFLYSTVGGTIERGIAAAE